MISSTPNEIATILAYHNEAPAYAMHSRARDHLDRLREPFMALLDDEPCVLDLGSGPGHDAALMAGLGATVVALDPAFGLLREARVHDSIVGSRVSGEARRLPFADASFDGLWSCASLLHIPHAEVAAALTEVHRVLKPGGFAFFSISEGDPSGSIAVTDTDLVRATRLYYYHDADAWGALVREHGFEIISHHANRDGGHFNPGSTGWIETFARKA